MKRLFQAMFLCAALPLSASDAYSLHPDRTVLKSPTSAPFTLEHLPVVSVRLGDRTFRFAVDTSVKCSAIIDRNVARDLGLSAVRRVPISNAGATADYDVVRLASLGVGNARFEGIDAISDDIRAGFGVDGLLGYGLFRDLVVTIDFAKSELRLDRGRLPRPDGRSVFALGTDDGVPSILVSLAGMPLEADVNLEVPAPIALLPAVAQAFTIEEKKISGALTIGDISIATPRVIVSDRLAACAIGMGALKGRALTFDEAHHRVQIAG